MKKNVKSILLAAGVAGLALVARLPGLGGYMTVDEVAWMTRSAQYWDAVLAGEAGATFVTTHPGATLMWLAGAGETAQAWRLGTEVRLDNLQHFRKAAVLPVSLAAAGLAGLAAWLMCQLWGYAAAGIGGAWLAVDPYLAGATQIVHLDGLLALFMLNSLLAWMVFYRRRKKRCLWGAGAMLGLAGATKLVLAAWLMPVMGMWVLVAMWRRREDWGGAVRSLGTVVGVAALVFWLAWPAAWVKADMTRSFTRDFTTAATWEHVDLDAGADHINPLTFYARTLAGRSTLLVWVGLVVAMILAVRRQVKSKEVMWLVIYALGFLAIMTLAAKKADRYALPALVVLPVLAGWAASQTVGRMSGRGKQVGAVLVAVVLGILVWSNWAGSYLISYSNPLIQRVRPLSQQGWGEGLEAAAEWLNEQPGVEDMLVSTWYPRVLQTYFTGKVAGLEARDDERVDYVVTYRNMGGRAPDTLASEVLAETQDREPVFTVSVKGVPYVWVYRQ